MLSRLIQIGVVPGIVQTELWDKMGQSKEQQAESMKKFADSLPVGFVATPEDVRILLRDFAIVTNDLADS